MLRLWNLSDEQINIMEPKTIDELSAELDVELLNANEPVSPPQKWQDHLTYMYAYYSANDTDVKYDAIEERKQMYIKEGGDAQQAELAKQGQEGNTLWNIASSNASQQNAALIQEGAGWVEWNINSSWI
jgi:hypothetical protein